MFTTRIHLVGRAWPASLPAPRIPAALVVVALLAAACGGSPASSGSGGSPSAETSTGSPSAVAYSACLRSDGVPSFPDPNSNGTIPKETAEQFGVSDSRYETARTCLRTPAPGQRRAEEGQSYSGR
ncbi:hypothetical protein ACXC9Q_30375 [Kribbella sp. CWNU-51]